MNQALKEEAERTAAAYARAVEAYREAVAGRGDVAGTRAVATAAAAKASEARKAFRENAEASNARTFITVT